MGQGFENVGLPSCIKVETKKHPRHDDLAKRGIKVNEDMWIYSGPRGKIEVVEVLKSSDTEEDAQGKPIPYFSARCLEGNLFEDAQRVNCGELLEAGMIKFLTGIYPYNNNDDNNDDGDDAGVGGDPPLP